MKLKNSLILLVACSLALIQGCAFKVNTYGASIENVEAMKTGAQGATMTVSPFTSAEPGLTSITCRAAGGVKTPNENSFESFIQNAFIDELKLAGAYDSNSSLVLNGHIEKLDFNSNIGAGKWIMSLRVSSNLNAGFLAQSVYEFSTNFVADKACQQVAQAFVPAVQKLIGSIVQDPRFQKLMKN